MKTRRLTIALCGKRQRPKVTSDFSFCFPYGLKFEFLETKRKQNKGKTPNQYQNYQKVQNMPKQDKKLKKNQENFKAVSQKF